MAAPGTADNTWGGDDACRPVGDEADTARILISFDPPLPSCCGE